MGNVCGVGSTSLGQIYSQQNEDIDLPSDGAIYRTRDAETGERFLALPADLRRGQTVVAMLQAYGPSGDTHALRALLRAHPEYIGEAARMTEDDFDRLIENQMRLDGHDAAWNDPTPEIVRGIAEECMASFVHNNIRDRGKAACAQSLASIQQARHEVDNIACQLNTVRAETPYGAALIQAGLTPGQITGEQISSRLDVLESHVRAVSTRLDADSWVPSEFPRAMYAAIHELGIANPDDDSMIWSHLEWEDRKDRVYHAAVAAAHVGVIVASGGHALVIEGAIFLVAEAAFAVAGHAHRPTQEQLARTANMIGL